MANWGLPLPLSANPPGEVKLTVKDGSPAFSTMSTYEPDPELIVPLTANDPPDVPVGISGKPWVNVFP